MNTANNSTQETAYTIKAPTLVLGIGGTGSLIVDRLAGRVKGLPGFDRVYFHVFDTDVNDLTDQVKYLSKNQITQTSAALTIGDVIDRNLADPALKEWFHHDQTLIRDKNLTKGAAQIRMISRLAMDMAQKELKFQDFEKSMNTIFQADGQATPPSPRVFIIGTLAGGTGSGIFIQLGLYLKDLFLNVKNMPNPQIFGSFILPNVLIQTGKINFDQQANTKANAYAAIKELTAFMARENKPNVELCWTLSQLENLNENRKPMNEPFSHVTLFDYFNQQNFQSGSFEDYLQIIEDAIYVDVLTKVTGNNETRLDNALLQNITQSGGKAYVLGSGAARIEYPKEDLYKLYSRKWVVEMLSGKWLKIDTEIKQQIKTAAADKKQGAQISIPVKEKLYPEILENLGTGDRPNPFFKSIYESTLMIVDQRTQAKSPKSKELHQSIDRLIEDTIQNNFLSKPLHENLNWDNESVKEKYSAVDYIMTFERNLKSFYEESKSICATYRTLLADKISINDAEENNFRQGAAYALNTYIFDTANGQCMHPIAVRAFLYRLNSSLKSEAESLRIEVNELESNISNYFLRAYDDPKTPKVVEDLSTRLRDIENSSGLFGILGDGWKKFAAEYKTKSTSQKNNILSYTSSKLRLNVYDAVIERLNLMLNNWNTFFNHLSDIISNFEDEIELLEKQHQSDNQVDGFEKTIVGNRRYILAGRSEKLDFWKNHFEAEASISDIDDRFSLSIYLNRYKDDVKHINRVRDGKPIVTRWEKEISEISRRLTIFTNGLLKNTGALEKDVFEALKYQCEFNAVISKKYGEDVESYIKEVLDEANNLAAPMLSPISGTVKGTGYNSWGIHPDVYNKFGSSLRDHMNENASNVIEDNGFAGNILIRFNAMYGIEPTHLWGVTEGGDLYKAYQNTLKLREVDGKKFVSRHLDKRWDEPAYMPDLNDARTAAVNQLVLQGMLYGISQKSIQLKRLPNRSLEWQFIHPKDNSTTPLSVFGEKADTTMYGLYQAIQFNSVICNYIVNHAKEQLSEDVKGNKRIGAVSFINELEDIQVARHNRIFDKCNIADVFFSISEEATSHSDASNIAKELLNTLLELLKLHYKTVRREDLQNENTKGVQEALKKFKELLSESRIFNERTSSAFKDTVKREWGIKEKKASTSKKAK